MTGSALTQIMADFVEEAAELAAEAQKHLLAVEQAGGDAAKIAPAYKAMARALHTLKGDSGTLGLASLSDLVHRLETMVAPARAAARPLGTEATEALYAGLDAFMGTLREHVAGAGGGDLTAVQDAIARATEAEARAPAAAREVAANEPKVAVTEPKVAIAEPKVAVAEPKVAVAEPKVAATEPKVTATATEPPARRAATTADLAATHAILGKDTSLSTLVAPPATASSPPDALDASYRVDSAIVARLVKDVERVRELRLAVDEQRRKLDEALAALARAEGAARAAEVGRDALTRAAHDAAAAADQAAEAVEVIEADVRALCTAPVRTILEPLPRVVRDVARASGKEARLVTSGDVALERRILAGLRAPLLHLVRNAVDHGLEAPADRARRGKSSVGEVSIRVERAGSLLFIEVADDGAGLDTAAIRAAAIERRLLPPEAIAALDEQQVFHLIFRPGFSTRATITEISGRGVGLDIVSAEVAALGGRIEVRSTPGAGTRFTLTVPTDLGSSQVLVARVGEHEIGIPMEAVRRVVRARRADIRATRTRTLLREEGATVGVRDLGELLELRRAAPISPDQALLVVSAEGREAALVVDAVAGDHDLVVRPLPHDLQHLGAYQGAAILGRGELLLVLRPSWLTADARREAPRDRGGRRALVVDDSITARAMHRTVLEADGFQVDVASSAAQALELARRFPYDVIVSDVSMAEVSGVQLTRTLRGRPEGRGVPILLVSARDDDTVRAAALSAGADAFLSKRECAAGRLIAEVGRALRARSGAA